MCLDLQSGRKHRRWCIAKGKKKSTKKTPNKQPQSPSRRSEQPSSASPSPWGVSCGLPFWDQCVEPQITVPQSPGWHKDIRLTAVLCVCSGGVWGCSYKSDKDSQVFDTNSFKRELKICNSLCKWVTAASQEKYFLGDVEPMFFFGFTFYKRRNQI